MRDTTIFYKSFYDAIKVLPPEEQVVLYNAIFEFQFEEIEPQLSGLCNCIFTLIRPLLEKANTKYENGKKGGRPKTKTKPNENQNETDPKPYKDKDKDKDKDEDKNEDKDEIKNQISFDEKFAIFKQQALAKGNRWAETIKKNNAIKDIAPVLDAFCDYIVETGKEDKFLANTYEENKSYFKFSLPNFYNPKDYIKVGNTEYFRDGKRYYKQGNKEYEAPLDAPPRPANEYIYDADVPRKWRFVGL